MGWYILFADDTTAYRVQRVLDTTAVQGHRLSLVVHTSSGPRAQTDASEPVTGGVGESKKGNWRYLTITKKSRPMPAVKKSGKSATIRRKVYSPSVSGSDDDDEQVPVMAQNRKRAPSYASSTSPLSEDDRPFARSVQREERDIDKEGKFSLIGKKEDVVSVKAAKGPKSKTIRVDSDEVEENQGVPLASIGEVTKAEGKQDDSTVVKLETLLSESISELTKGKKRPTKAKGGKATKKVRLDQEADDAATKIQIDEDIVPQPPKKKKVVKTEVDKLLASGVLMDEEDAYWLGRVLAAQEDGLEPIWSDGEEDLVDEGHPLFHKSGAWRAEGWKKVAQVQKSRYLPQRNRAVVNSEDVGGITTGRTARLAGRDQHRQTAAVAANNTVESDLFAFNQLRIRKKQLRFARSAIEGYGLYAMETIHAGEMVCEYVGDLVRATVADVREQRYLKQGIGSSYLFRIDNDIVCDATFKGSVR